MAEVRSLTLYDGVVKEIADGDTMVGTEPLLGNPSASGYVLASTDTGERSWVPQGGSMDVRYVLVRSLM